MEDFDRATLHAVCVNGAEQHFETRRRDLMRRLKNDPSEPAKPQFTQQEMREAAQRLMSSVLKTGKIPVS